MYSITFEWIENEQLRSVKIHMDGKTKNPHAIRIGRDDQQCDLALPQSEKTVSRLHLEIFQPDVGSFYLRNLTKTNPPEKRNPAIVDGQLIMEQEVPVQVGTQVQVGKLTITLKAIQTTQAKAPVKPAPVYILKCNNLRTPHELPLEFTGSNCPYCGHLVLKPTYVNPIQ
ncbi:MAG: FHA domain-containing protein [Synechococcales cyanobacterium]